MHIDVMKETLRSFRDRRPMYIYPVDVQNAENFLLGFRIGYFSAEEGKQPGSWMDLWREILNERGWKESAIGPVVQMRDKAMTDEEIIQELVAIEIALLEKIQQTLECTEQS